MYDVFYHLKHDPFAETPDPAFLFLSSSHKKALHALLRGLDAQQGLLAMVGAAGLGKTTLLQAIQERLQQQQVQTIAIMYPKLLYGDILELICQEGGFDSASDDPATLLSNLQRTLRAGHKRGWRLVLLIDEAHHLPALTLAGLLQLLDLRTATGAPLLQIVLAGLPTLLHRNKQPVLGTLQQHLAVRVTLAPLRAKESLAYIRHRLAKVLIPEDLLFTSGALQRLIRAARGNPRVLHTLCTNLLIAGALRQQQPIAAPLAQEVLADAGLTGARPLLRWASMAAATMLLGVGLWSGWQTTSTPPLAAHQPAPPSSVVQPPPEMPLAPYPEEPQTAIMTTAATSQVTGVSAHEREQQTPIASVAPAEPPQPALDQTAQKIPRLSPGPAQSVAPTPSAFSAAQLRALDRQFLRQPEVSRPIGYVPPAVATPTVADTTIPASLAPLPQQQTSPMADERHNVPPVAKTFEQMQSMPDRQREIRRASMAQVVVPAKVQTVHFHSLPEAATVSVNGKVIGRTPVSAPLAIGSYTIFVEKSGYSSIEYQLKIERDGENNLYHDLQMNTSEG